VSGYTPVFSSIFDGTLHGKWPQTGVWLALLAMADRHGCVDRTLQAIASDIGISADELMTCIGEFCEPDPMSRTQQEGGRRLVLIEPSRPWGWRIVNHGIYREKARLQGKDAARVASGVDAERKRAQRESPAVPRSPPLSPSHTSDSDSDSDSDKTKKKPKSKSALPRASRVPESFSPDLDYARTQCPDIDAAREVQKFRDWEFKTPRTDWAACWRTWVGNCRDSGKYARQPANGGMMFGGKPVEWQ